MSPSEIVDARAGEEEASLRAEDDATPGLPRPSLSGQPASAPSLAHLLRMLRLSFRYPTAIAGVVVCASLFSASRYVRTWMLKPMVDDLIVPAQIKTKRPKTI